MTTPSSREDGGASRQSVATYGDPYALVTLLLNVSLSEDGGQEDIRITCVEFWNDNLYIGTSAAELLHYVLIPPGSEAEEPQFILASRLQPEFLEASSSSPGVQQIVVLPQFGKACVLCNATLTFYSLPELSPAYGGSTKISKCSWIGGIDEDNLKSDAADDGALVMICVEKRIQIIRIGERPRKVRAIELHGCLRATRRGSIACVADSRSYSLLEIVEQQQIPLFEINPQQNHDKTEDSKQKEKALPSIPVATENNGTQSPSNEPQGHEDTPPSTSTNDSNDPPEDSIKEKSPGGAIPPRKSSLEKGLGENEQQGNTEHLSTRQETSERVPGKSSVDLSRSSLRRREPLKPNIACPSRSEFLLTTGTSHHEPGVGIFVNLDGDVVRGTFQFSRYPDTIVTDGPDIEADDLSSSSSPDVLYNESYVLAIVNYIKEESTSKIIEVQRLDVDPADESSVYQLDPREEVSKQFENGTTNLRDLGLTSTQSQSDVFLPDTVEKLRLIPIELNGAATTASTESPSSMKDERKQTELRFATQLSQTKTSLLTWTAESIWWVVRRPRMLRLDSNLDLAISSIAKSGEFVDRKLVEDTLGLLNDSNSKTQPRNELDILGSRYIHQKASLILFYDLVKRVNSGIMIYERDREVTVNLLTDDEGAIDPRIIIANMVGLQEEVVINGDDGIWMQAGLHQLWNEYNQSLAAQPPTDARNVSWESLLQVVKRCLMHWRRRKGYASVANDKSLFRSIDAALLRLLLVLDESTPPGRAVKGSVRSELNTLVDEGVDCFERGVELLEEHQRLYILSRLYQGRRQYAKVLGTWKRIVEGEVDKGGELGNGEEEIRDYLTKRKDRALIQEYGTWLALRNPKIGVQIFAEPKSQLKFEPREVIELLKAQAPNAVKDYLEQLVFGNHLAQYANDLIGYYLDSVLDQINSSETARESLSASYEAYRALSPPKPTYSQFVSDNAIDAKWWQNRRRLLQLLGESHVAASKYDTEGILGRIEPHKELLVPETIILSGRQGRHTDALRLLTHGLGDYDTAVSYCVLGGSSTYSSADGNKTTAQITSHEEQMTLFRFLLQEFLDIKDLNDKITQTSELIGRFSGWFDIEHVISTTPESWSVEKVSAFLESALRVLQSERAEAAVVKALTSSQNLSSSAKVVEKTESLGAELLQGRDGISVKD